MTNRIQTDISTRRIGLFGGTFNPIHVGHVQAARDARKQFGLDQIHLIPCALPPHKFHGSLAPAQDRVEMARLALKGTSAITVSTIEIDRPGPTYTVDTLEALSGIRNRETSLFFLVGVDAFLEVHTWKSFTKLFDLATFVVMSRPSTAHKTALLSPRTVDYIQHHISTAYTLTSDGRALVHPEKKTIYLAQITPIAIASSQIRDKVRLGEPIHQWVHPAVSEYIDRKGLYR
jgi:nicotinate-nucleotide adenylyltransferase